MENMPKQQQTEHHVPVVALEPVLPLAELVGMLENRPVAEIVHHRGLNRGPTILKNHPEYIIGQKVPDQFSPGHPAEASNIADRFIIDKLLLAHQGDMGRFIGCPSLTPSSFLTRQPNALSSMYWFYVMGLSIRSHHKPVMRNGLLFFLYTSSPGTIDFESSESGWPLQKAERFVPAERGTFH
jgi:hypothetical protein